MSSSLLIILLVIVWLFVLAPMLIRSRNPIRRTGDALAQTKTLYAGGSRRLVPRRARSTADTATVDADDALFGLPTGSGATDVDLVDREEWVLTVEQTLRKEAAGRRGEAVRQAMAARRAPASEDDTSEFPPVSPRAAESIRETVRERVEVREDSLAGAGREDVREVASVDGAAAHEERTSRRERLEYVEELEYAEVDEYGENPDELGHADHDDELVVDGELVRRRAERSGDASLAGSDENVGAALIDEEAELGNRGRRRRQVERVELTEADIDFAERRRGRGAYDPMADRESAEKRYRARQRTALILVGLVVLSALVAVLTTPAVWWFAGGAVLLLAAYLTYLRRQVRLEESLRHRRIERMRRARLGVESHEDDELSVIPPRLRRPGAVVLEVDDEDPAFDTLDTHDPVREAPREREDRQHHLRRAVG